MYKRLLQEEGNNSFSMPRAQVIMALNCNSESIWAFSIGLYFFQVTDYSPTRYSHKMCCSHSYTVWLHPWTLCDSQAAVGQLSGLRAGGAELWCRMSTELKSRGRTLALGLCHETDTGESQMGACKWNHHSGFSHLRFWLQNLSLSLFMTPLITTIWPNPNHNICIPVQWSVTGQKAVLLSTLRVSHVILICDWGKLYTVF